MARQLILFKQKGANIPEKEEKDLTIQAGSADGSQNIFIRKDVVTIGRSADMDIITTSKRVSRNHCTLIKRNNEWFIQDQKSTSGTYINRYPGEGKEEYIVQLISGEFPLKSGDIISLGGLIKDRFVLVFTFGGE